MQTLKRSPLLFVLALAACGGGGSSSEDAGTDSPIATSSAVTGTAAALSANGTYVIQNDDSEVELTLPDIGTLAVDDTITLTGEGAGGWKIVQAEGQSILTTGVVDADLDGVAGASWTLQDSARDWTAVASSDDGNRLVAVAAGGYIYTSTDAGQTWTARATDSTRLWKTVTSSADGTQLAAAVDRGGIFTSSDGGESWIEQTGIEDSYWSSMASTRDGTKLYSVALLATSKPGDYNYYPYGSTDGGQTWTICTTDECKALGTVAFSDDGRLSGNGYNTGIYASTDVGASWSQIPFDGTLAWNGLAVSADGSRLSASVDGGYLYTSTDSGQTWLATLADTSRNWHAVATSSDGKGIVATCYDGCLFTSADGGDTWQDRLPDSAEAWNAVAMSANGHLIVAAATDEQLYVSTLTGTTAGTKGSLSGAQGVSLTLTYLGNGQFSVTSHTGTLSVR